ncbi:MAG: hypothetical protein WAW86_10105 [Gammaproteobacteria bacterium]
MIKRSILVAYKTHQSMNDYECFYCGFHGESKDHVPAVSHARDYPEYERLLVRSCLMCNSLLGHRFLPTLHLRSSYLLEKYRRKLMKIISMPDWAEDEIEELQALLLQH